MIKNGSDEKQKGAALILVAGLIVVLVSFVALAIDIGYVMVSRNEIQNAADSSALGATRQLGAIYESMTYQAQQSYTADPSPIIAVAKSASLSNKVSGQSIDLIDSEVQIGQWNAASKTFTATLSRPDAVRVTAHRDAILNGAMPSFFARIFGINSLEVSTNATAALTALGGVEEGGLPLPVGISRFFFANPEYCDDTITFYPSNKPSSCAGWHVYDEPKFNDAKLRQLIDDLRTGVYTSPATIAGETIFNFGGGTMSQQTFNAFLALFNYARLLNDGVIDADTNDATWTAKVPVYDWPDCGNPNKEILIVGFATVVIDNVLDAPEKLISGQTICHHVEPGRGGGGDFGTLGSIPGLVQ